MGVRGELDMSEMQKLCSSVECRQINSVRGISFLS